MGEFKEKLTVESIGENLKTIRRFVTKCATACNFSESELYDIKVATGEATANAVEHGSPDGGQNKITVEFVCQQDKSVITIADQGKFKRQAADYDADGLHHRGRGMAFMLALMDEVDIKTGSEGTVVRMVKMKQN